MPLADWEPRLNAGQAVLGGRAPHFRTATPRITESVTEPGKWLTLVELFGSHRPPRTVACRGVSTPEGRHQPRVAPNSAIKVSQIIRPFTQVSDQLNRMGVALLE